jgi:hypothetical protein
MVRFFTLLLNLIMRKNLFYAIWLLMPMLLTLSCSKNNLPDQNGLNNVSKYNGSKPNLRALDIATPNSIFFGGAFNMATMAYPGAALWSTDAAYGVGLHVHPVGWRGQFSTLGPPISANLVNKSFTYEMDIVDPRNGVNNVAEVQSVMSYGLTCARVMCNVDVGELDTNSNLPTELLNSVVKPFNNIGVAVDILFSPVSPPAIAPYRGSTHIARLMNATRWTTLLFNQAHAQGVALDIPLEYYSGYRGIIDTILKQSATSGHEVTWVANCAPTDNVNLISNLSTILSTLRGAGLAPTRWVCDQFSSPNFSPVPEMNSDGSPQATPAGAALFLSRNTLSIGGTTEYFHPDTTQYYEITGKQSGKCLDVSGVSMADNAQIWLWTYGAGPNQQWHFSSTTGGYYKIISKNSGKCLAAATTANTNGVNIVQLTYNGGYNEQWQVIYVNNGFRFVNRATGKDIDVQGFGVTNGSTVWEYDYIGGANQQWFFTPVGHI